MAMRVVGGGIRRRVTKGSTGHMLGCSVALWAFFACGTSSKKAPAPPETAKQFMLSVHVAGDGQGSISGGPIQCGSRCSGPVGAGQSPVVLVAEPADDSTVSGWSISGCDGTQCSVAVDRDLTVGINFARKVPPRPPPVASDTRRIAVALEEDGLPFDGSGFSTVSAQGTALNCPLTCAADIPVGSKIQLDFKTSNPFTILSHWRLARWRGPCVPAGDSCTITLDEDATVTAIVEVHPRTIVFVSNSHVSAGRGTFATDRDRVYLSQRDETGAFVLELGESVTLTPLPTSNSHFIGWAGACAAAGMGPCKLTATRDESVNLQLSFDPNVDARYQLTAMVPLAHASAMRSGTVLGQAKDGNAALCDLDTGRVTRILPANSVAKAVNRRGDVAGESDGHPFVTYATDRSVVLDAISGHAVALNDGGVMLGIAYNPPVARRPTFTFDGSTVTWLPGTDFWGDTINNSGAVGGCIGMNEWAENGGIFQNRVLSRISPSACVDHLNGAGAAVGTNWSSKAMRHSVLWDGSSYDIWDLNEANDLADDGTIAGSIDFDGYFAGRTSDSYQFGLHAALYTDAQVQDLNFLTDTTGHPEVAHVAMERALAVDGGKILVSFRNGRFGVIEPVTAR